jgi:hypothetical protein
MTEESNAPVAEKKKAKPPALEEKPFNEYILNHFLPALEASFAKQNITGITLEFVEAPIPYSDQTCWQVVGNWPEKNRQFNVYYIDGNLNGQKAFTVSTHGIKPSILESFMIDEKKVNLDLMVLFVLKRLNGQKWLTEN